MFSQRGQLVVEAGVLEHDAERSPHLVLLRARVEAVDAQRAAGGLEQGGQHLDGGGLAGAVRAEKGEDLPFSTANEISVHGAEVAEVLHQVADFDHCIQNWRIPPPTRPTS